MIFQADESKQGRKGETRKEVKMARKIVDKFLDGETLVLVQQEDDEMALGAKKVDTKLKTKKKNLSCNQLVSAIKATRRHLKVLLKEKKRMHSEGICLPPKPT